MRRHKEENTKETEQNRVGKEDNGEKEKAEKSKG